MTTWIGSPNYRAGRALPIDRIVIHWMVGTLASTDTVFQDKNRGTSAHYGIENGNVHQYVYERDTAFHAGVGTMNARSLGIEHSAAPGREATPETIETSARLIADLATRHSIPLDRQHVIKHSEVPYATQCSGTIPIDYLVERAKQLQGGNMDKYDAVPHGDDVGFHYRNRLFREATSAEKANKANLTWAQILDDNVTELGKRLKAAEATPVNVKPYDGPQLYQKT